MPSPGEVAGNVSASARYATGMETHRPHRGSRLACFWVQLGMRGRKCRGAGEWGTLTRSLKSCLWDSLFGCTISPRILSFLFFCCRVAFAFGTFSSSLIPSRIIMIPSTGNLFLVSLLTSPLCFSPELYTSALLCSSLGCYCTVLTRCVMLSLSLCFVLGEGARV